MSGGPPGAKHEPERHVVVLDCNIYLDAAYAVGPPFRWAKFDALVAGMARQPVPHPGGQQLDSLRLIAMCTSGRFAGDQPVEVWTNSHIEGVVRSKAIQPTVPDPKTGYRGLGWTEEAADSLLDVLVDDLTAWSNGGTLGSSHMPDGNPPLDHEDGMVFGACRWLAADDPLAHVYCVTRDSGFLKSYQAGALGSHTTVLPPAKLVAAMRLARQSQSMRGMPPPR